MAEYIFKSHVIKAQQSPSLLMDFMDLDSDKWRQYADSAYVPMKWVYQREAKLIAIFEQQVSQRFDACFFITETEKALFSKTIGVADNIFAVENGIDTDMFKPALHKELSDHPVLLFTGVMDYAPNVDAVIWFVENVWQQVLDKWPMAQFYIAGMSPSEKVKALSNKQGVEVTGYVDDILPFFDKATIFVGPFRIARGVQNKVLQAFACGVPVVSTSMGAEGIRCEDGHSILLAKTPEDFMMQLTRLSEDKTLRENISNKALDIIKNFYAWDSVLAPFDRVLKEKTSSDGKKSY
jgi:sugar transferase (PEP-CTERM/EpsH1 system associated)